jgi:chemotaxis signal transduction protein
MLVVPFEVARYMFALPLDRVMRVEPMAQLLALPRPVANVAGALVHEGRPLAVYDLRKKFHLGHRAWRASDCLVLGRAPSGLVAVAADAVATVTEIAVDPDGDADRPAAIAGAAVIGDRIVLIQDLDRFLDDQEAVDLAEALQELQP